MVIWRLQDAGLYEHDMFWRTNQHITINYTAQYLLKAIQITHI